MGFQGNVNLNKSGEQFEFTTEQIQEIIKCKNDPIYFIKNYIYIVNLDKGKIKFDLYPFQEKLINIVHNENRVIAKIARQSGKTTSIAAYIVHYANFNNDKNIAILANKDSMAKEILYRIRIMIELLPSWMQAGIVEWNKGSIELDNGSRIITSATSSSAIRGKSTNFLLLDEFAFVQPGVFEDFFQSVYPTISSSLTAKIIMISTPWGLNHFYKFWMDAVNNKNGYTFFETNWNEIPGRDNNWRKNIISEIGEQRFKQEFEASFLGSSNTLIEPSCIKNLVCLDPIKIQYDGKFLIYEFPKTNKNYVLMCDTGEGVGDAGDFSAIQIIDVTNIPHKQVACYRDNEIKPHLFANVINNIGIYYNSGLVIAENNTIGIEVLNNLNYNCEYPNIFFYEKKFGLRMTKGSKNMGCSHLKTFIETDKLILCDFNTINELSTFVKKPNGTFSAEKNKHDDLISPLILFSYFISKENLVDKWIEKENLINEIYNKKIEEIEENLIPVGFLSDIYLNDEI